MILRDWDVYNEDLVMKKLRRNATNSLYGANADRCWIDEPLSNSVLPRTVIDQLAANFRKIEEEKKNKMIIQNAKAIIEGKTYKVRDMRITHECGAYPVAELTVDMTPLTGVVVHNTGSTKVPNKIVKAAPIHDIPDIKHVIFNYPATIVFWADGTKTVVKCKPGDQWDPHAGISAAIAKKFFGTQVNKWVKNAEYAKLPPVEEDEVQTVSSTIVDTIKDTFFGGH